MIRLRRLSQSLANRYMLLAVAMVVATTLLLGFAAARGVYTMALRSENAKQRAQRDIIVSGIAARVQTSSRILRTLAQRDALGLSDEPTVRKALANAYSGNVEYLQRVILLDAAGGIVAAYPSADGLTAEVRTSALTTTAPGAEEYVWVPTRDGKDTGTLWVTVPADTDVSTDHVLVGEIRTSFIKTVLEQIAASEKHPTAFLVDADCSTLFAAGDERAYTSPSSDFTPISPGAPSGDVDVEVNEDAPFHGVYADLTGLAGIQWRVVVVEPGDVVAGETWLALAPAVATWALSSLVSVLLTIVGVSVLVRPLRMLEAQARAAASGAPLEPIATTRRDEVGRLMESFDLVVARLNRLHDVTQLLARTANRDEVLDGIVTSFSHMFTGAVAGVWLLEDDSRRLRLARSSDPASMPEGGVMDLAAVGWMVEALASREVRSIPDNAGPDLHASLSRGGSDNGCGLVVPLTTPTDTLGVVVVAGAKNASFSDAEVEMARSFSAQASVALENARLFAEERSTRRTAEVLRGTAELVSGHGDLRGALDAIARVEAGALGMGPVFIALVQPRVYGTTEAREVELERSFLDAWAQLDRRGERYAPVEVFAEQPGPFEACARALDARYLLLTPLYRDLIFSGLIVLGHREGCPGCGRSELEIAETIGKQVSLALENAFHYEQAESRADNLETVFRISQAVSSSLQSKVVLNRVLDVVQKIFTADAVMLMTYERDRKIMIVPMARGILHPLMLEMEFASGVDLPGEVFETREPQRIGNLKDYGSPLTRAACARGLTSALVVPLLARGRSIGVLAVFAMDKDAFTLDDMELLRTFGSQAALAIDTANLFSREHHVVQVLQGSIMPSRPPEVPGMDTSSVYVPAGSEAEIGGDYYDLFADPQGRLVLAIGDVCGKGVEAATKTSMIKYSIRGMVVAGLDPGAILGHLNAQLVAEDDPAGIVTLWLGVLDPRTGSLVWANGGHPPALLRQPGVGGAIVRLETTGALLGAVRSVDYGESRTCMEPGSTLLLYTDGVTEARDRGRFFGEGRVRRALRKGGSAAAITQRLLAMVQRFSAGELRDDAAVLTVKRLADE